MFDLATMRRETRYGVPAADQVLYNRHYVLGYSYYIRQAKWALEIVTPDLIDIDRRDNFRADYRVPWMFRADLDVYKALAMIAAILSPVPTRVNRTCKTARRFCFPICRPRCRS